MSDLKKYISKRKLRDKNFAKNYDFGYKDFKLGFIIKELRERKGLTQSQLASKIKTKKTAISRIENHAEDIRLSTLEKIAEALGHELRVQIL